jgi:hypothetical protein
VEHPHRRLVRQQCDEVNRRTNHLAQSGPYEARDTLSYTVPGCFARPAADLNGDCRVDFADLALLASQGLASGTPPAP